MVSVKKWYAVFSKYGWEFVLRFTEYAVLWTSWLPLVKDKKLLEAEYAEMMFVRSSSAESKPMHRAELLDKFNFLILPGTVALSPKKLSPPPYKSRVYLYQAVRKIVLSGWTPSSEDTELIEILETGMGEGTNGRMDRWLKLTLQVCLWGSLKMTENIR